MLTGLETQGLHWFAAAVNFTGWAEHPASAPRSPVHFHAPSSPVLGCWLLTKQDHLITCWDVKDTGFLQRNEESYEKSEGDLERCSHQQGNIRQTSILFPYSQTHEDCLKHELLTSQIHLADGLGALIYSTLSSVLYPARVERRKQMEVNLSETEPLLPWWTTMPGFLLCDLLFLRFSHISSLSIWLHWFSQL